MADEKGLRKNTSRVWSFWDYTDYCTEGAAVSRDDFEWTVLF